NNPGLYLGGNPSLASAGPAPAINDLSAGFYPRAPAGVGPPNTGQYGATCLSGRMQGLNLLGGNSRMPGVGGTASLMTSQPPPSLGHSASSPSMSAQLAAAAAARSRHQQHPAAIDEFAAASFFFDSTGGRVGGSAGLEQQQQQQQQQGKANNGGRLEPPPWYVCAPAGDQSQFSNRGDALTYMEAETRRSLLARAHSLQVRSDPLPGLPQSLLHYSQLTPLENPSQIRRSATLGLPSLCYKAYNARQQQWVLLRRFVGASFQPANEAIAHLDALKEADHPHLAPVRDAFYTQAFGDQSACLVTDFYPGCATMLLVHCSDPMKASSFQLDAAGRLAPQSAKRVPLQSEHVMWNLLLQLASAVRYCHARLNRAVRALGPSKVLVEDKQRLRVNLLGAREILCGIPATDEDESAVAKQQDLVDLGRLLLVLACGTPLALQDLNAAMELVGRSYSKDLASVMHQLLYGVSKSIYDVMPAIGARFFDHLCESQLRVDFLELQLTRQLENGRLLRLISKLSTVCEREMPSEPSWTDSTDRQMLRLFRDFVFHQTDSSGGFPWIDLAHIVSCLQKLDMGSQQRLCLVSRDSQQVMLVTYAEVKQWLDSCCAQLNKLMEAGMRQQAEFYSGTQPQADNPAAAWSEGPPPSAV
ncbi:hypothetical protein BOX15_Mlig015773g1, partial [Macrostomum lignano]